MTPPIPKHLSLPRKLLLKVLNAFSYRVMLPAMRFIARDLPNPHPAPGGEPNGYVEAVGYINPVLVMAAQAECARTAEADPAGYQAVLNACMEAIRADGISRPMVAMFGHLVGVQGYRPDEALIRVCANFLNLGMYVERRLALRFAGEPEENEV